MASDVIFNVGRLGTGEALTEARTVSVTAVDGSVEAQLAGGHPSKSTDRFDRLLHLPRNFLDRRGAAELLCEGGIDAGEFGEVGILIERNSNRSRLLRQGLEYGLADPPDGVRNEFDALVRVELLDRLPPQPLVADAHELCESQATALVLLHIRDNEPEIRRYESFSGFFVPGSGPPR